MDSNRAFLYIIVIGFLLVATTIILALKGKKRITKYYPVIFGVILAIIFCIATTMILYSNYIVILYVVVFTCVSPGIGLSLVIAGSFDLIKFMLKKSRGEKQWVKFGVQ